MALETRSASAYDPVMTERSEPAQPGVAWQASLARSKGQIASGESVPLLPIRDRLRTSAEHLEAEQAVTADGESLTARR